MDTTPDVAIASPADTATFAVVLGDAFSNDPMMSWAFPDPATRPRILESMFGLIALHRYLPAAMSTKCGDDAVALWTRPTETARDDFYEKHGAEFAAALAGHTERISKMGEAMAAHHPTEPHAYLLAIGVRSASQGRGLGSLLLAHTLAEADRRGEPAYLEATSPRSRALYERHGFEVTGEITVDDSPSMWPMWREPRPR
ncbi:MAG: GNAT family N-acetyltransferase [Acidimicrobiales bacterium]